MTTMPLDLDTLSARVQETVYLALLSQITANFSISTFFSGSLDVEDVTSAAFNEPMAAATIIRASFVGAFDALAFTYWNRTLPKIAFTDVELPSNATVRSGDVLTAIKLFNDTIGAGRSAEESFQMCEETQPYSLTDTARVTASFVLALIGTSDALLEADPNLQGL